MDLLALTIFNVLFLAIAIKELSKIIEWRRQMLKARPRSPSAHWDGRLLPVLHLKGWTPR